MLILNPDSVSEPLSDPLFRRISRIAERLGVDAYVVGGYVRDHYLRRPSTDIDVVVVGSGIDVARALAAELHTQVTVYKTFGTAMLRAGGAEVDRLLERYFTNFENDDTDAMLDLFLPEVITYMQDDDLSLIHI